MDDIPICEAADRKDDSAGMLCNICDWIYGNRSKSHIGSYEIIDFKDFNTLRVVSMRMKLSKKVDHFTVFNSFSSTGGCSQEFPPNNL